MRRVIRRWGVYGVVLLFVVVVLGPALLGHGVLLDTDSLTIRAPWGVKHHIDAIVCRSDTYDFYLPGIKNIKEALWSGHLALWAPDEVGGTPLLSLPNHAALNPLSWPYFVLPLWLAPAFVKLGELVAVLVGMAAFLGRLGVRRPAALIAGLLFFCSGYMVMWTGWPQTRVGAWIPALFWALDRVATRRGARDVAFVGLIVAAMLLGGFPAVTLFALTAGGVYVLCRVSPRSADGWRRVVWGWLLAGAGVVLGAALAAVQLLPFLRDLDEIGLGDRAAGPHPPLGQLATVVAPNVLGNCVTGLKTGPVNPIEGIAFLGVAALALVLCALVLPRSTPTSTDDAAPYERVRWLLAGLLAGVVVLVWLGTPLLSLLQRLPGYDTNNIGRATSVFGFLGAALAGIGLERLWTTPRQRWSRTRLVTAGAVVLAVLVAAAWVFRAARHEIIKPTKGPAVYDHALVLPAAVAIVVIAGLGVALRWRRVGACIVVTAALVQSAVFAHTEWPLSSRSSFYPETAVHRFLSEHLGHDRYDAAGGTMLPATSDWYHLRTATGHEFTQPQWRALLEQVAPDTMLTATFSQFPSTLTLPQVASSHALDLLSVRYWVTGPGEQSPGPTMPVVLSTADATVFERTTALPRIRWQEGSRDGLRPPRPTNDGLRPPRPTKVVQVERDDPGHLTVDVDAERTGHLVVADAIVRAGWTATVDGRAAPITRAEGAFGAVEVPAGKHRIRLAYRPPELANGAAVSGGALLLCVGLLTVSRVRRRKPAPLDSGA